MERANDEKDHRGAGENVCATESTVFGASTIISQMYRSHEIIINYYWSLSIIINQY